MDPAALLVSVQGLAAALDHFSETSEFPSPTFPLIRTQVGKLGTGVQGLQGWLHFTDPTSTAQVMSSLYPAIETVRGAVERLRDDLESVTQANTASDATPAGHEQQRRTEFLYDESGWRKHLTDLRECVSLIHFTLNVCQLPVGQGAEREVEELSQGARTLQRVHASSGRERQSVLFEQQSAHPYTQSTEFENFMTSVVDAEDDLSESSSPLTRRSSWDTTAMTLDTLAPASPRHVQTNRNEPLSQELQLRTAQNVPSSPSSPTLRHHDTAPNSSSSAHFQHSVAPNGTLTYTIPSRSLHPDSGSRRRESSAPSFGTSYHPEPYTRAPNIKMTGPPPPLQKQLTRKPLGRSTVSEGSQPSELSSRVPARTRSKTTNVVRRTSGGLRPPTTSVLFGQASRSLTSLIDDESDGVAETEVGEDVESPPPYVEHASLTSPALNPKRRNTNRSHIPAASSQGSRQAQDDGLDGSQESARDGPAADEAATVAGRAFVTEAPHLRRHTGTQSITGSSLQPHAKDYGGNTALHYAALRGDTDECKLLIKAGAHFDEYNRHGESPIILAARGGHTQAVEYLLDCWVVQNGSGTTLQKGFLEASKSGVVSTAQEFLIRGVKPKKIQESWKPLCFAAQSGSLQMMDFMLLQKCSLKDRSPEGWTPLHFAAAHGHTAMAEKLLALKVPSKAETKKTEETAMHLATIANHTSTALALMLHKDANITVKDADSQQPIHHAVRNGNLELTAALLHRGAKLNDQTKYGWYPMHLAVAYGHLSLVAEFITRGVSLEEKLGAPSFRPSQRTNPAARKGYWAEIRWPHPGARALHLALEFGQDEVANTLIASSAKLEDPDSRGWRPLHYAAFNCRAQMVDLLLSRGVSPHATTDDNNTALSLGFRGPGLMASNEEKQYVVDSLQVAMSAHKKSKLKQLTKPFAGTTFAGVMSNKSREVAERNKAWHTAELAAALYSADQFGEEDDGASQITPSIYSQNGAEGAASLDGNVGGGMSSPQLGKTGGG